ncbi:MAG: putative CDP-glycerol:glycerophosphate glycerophosphotransferase [Chlamydiae bacterium]|nr:putative CDP-glycerol:glycerophosphate glycerophosphotransferase [Chlamydiota bacterium]
MNKTAAISTGPSTHLDHLAPLCALLDIPLVVTELDHIAIGERFYPMVDIQYVPLEELTLETIATNFDTIIETGKFWAMELKPLINMLFGKEILFIFSPHGNSDKEDILGKEVEQDIDLVYGPQMHKLKPGRRVIEIGNVRHWFYQKYKSHFDEFADEAISIDPEKKTVLYAPTWTTTATTSSFFSHAEEVIGELKKEVNLIIKLHPLLEENDPAAFHRIIGKYEKEVTFLLDFPAIYPLLEKVDIYLGDTSSIGYDFLYYNRPMFFLGKNGSLTKCGEPFRGETSLQNSQEELSHIRKKAYEEAFGPVISGSDLREKIEALLEKAGPKKIT